MTEWNATNYNRISTLQKFLAEEHLALVTLQGSEAVLDIGCGDGVVSDHLAQRLATGSVLGVDASHHMIDFASAHFSQPNLRFEVADVCALPYREEFDLVVSFNALHWVKQQEQALQSIRQSLKPDGRAILEFVPGGHRRALEVVIEELCSDSQWSEYFEGFEQPFAHFLPEEYRTLAEHAGLTVMHLSVEEGTWDFGDRASFLNFCQATYIEWLHCLPADQKIPFLEEALDRFNTLGSDPPEKRNLFEFRQMIVDLRRG